MDKQQLFSILIAFLMIGSIIGTAAILSQPKRQSNNENQTLPVTSLTDIKDFKATDVQAKIVQFTPSFVLQAYAVTNDIDLIDSAIKGISGVDYLSSKFVPHDNNVIYVADIRVRSIDDVADIQNAILSNTNNLLSSAVFFRYVYVQPVNRITFTEVNHTDVTESLDVNSMGAFVYNYHKISDTVQLDCSAKVNVKLHAAAGAVLCQETFSKPESSQFNILSFDANATVQKLSNVLGFTAQVSYSHNIDINAVEQSLESVTDANTVSLDPFTAPVPVLHVTAATLSDNNASSLFTDITNNLSAIEGVIDVNDMSSGHNYSAYCTFERSIDVNALKQNIQTVFSDFNMTPAFDESKMQALLSGTIEFVSEEINPSAVEQVFSNYGLTSKLFRIGTVELPSTVFVKGTQYTIGVPTAQAALSLTATEGDNVSLFVIGLLNDNNVVQTVWSARDKVLSQH